MIRNLPTPEGRALGEQMARFADQECVPDERCSTCAFRSGTEPNGCAPTLMNAFKCLVEHEPFYCHEAPPGEVRLCAGWRALFRPDHTPVTMPWDYIDGADE